MPSSREAVTSWPQPLRARSKRADRAQSTASQRRSLASTLVGDALRWPRSQTAVPGSARSESPPGASPRVASRRGPRASGLPAWRRDDRRHARDREQDPASAAPRASAVASPTSAVDGSDSLVLAGLASRVGTTSWRLVRAGAGARGAAGRGDRAALPGSCRGGRCSASAARDRALAHGAFLPPPSKAVTWWLFLHRKNAPLSFPHESGPGPSRR